MKFKTKKASFSSEKQVCFLQPLLQKKAMMLREIIIHLILIGLIFIMFFMATAGRVSKNEVRQQVIEKQIALMIDAAEPGTTISMRKIGDNGFINDISAEAGSIHVVINDFISIKGYPYFTKSSVSVRDDVTKFYIDVR